VQEESQKTPRPKRLDRDPLLSFSLPLTSLLLFRFLPPRSLPNRHPLCQTSDKMKIRRKWWKLALVVVALVVAAQIGVSFLVRTRRLHSYLTWQLSRAFGRPVQVNHFEVQLLPTPSFNADHVTVDEDPAFGNEYFLRAENLSANLRWLGLLRGRFEFGTLSLTRPSLILVRNAEGRWNLEHWLPPAKGASAANTPVYGPPAPLPSVQRLLRIAFDDGRIDFKNGDEKLAFALTEVSGSVDQVSAGRWQLQLKAQPWRSGVVLQSVGTLRVRGDIAGTSARLQPARITLHWDEVSIADLLRLLRGRDYGVRGVLALDGTLKSGTSDEAASAEAAAGVWSFSVNARAAQIHRWDLAERSDNPRVNCSVSGHWNVAAANIQAEEVRIEGPRSNLRGTASYIIGPAHAFEAHLDSAGIQATDLLAWYRAFHPGVDDGISAEQFFTGAAAVRGWPIQVQGAAFSSNGGTVKIPGLKTPVRVGLVHGGRERGTLAIEPVRVALGGSLRDVLLPRRRRVATLMENAADFTLVHDMATHSGSISIEGHAQKVEDVLKLAAAFGHPLNHGWELTGDVLADTRWDWQSGAPPRWNGRIVLNKSKLALAGLNQPLDIQSSTLNWKDGLRSVDVSKVNGFGGAWTGSITETVRSDAVDNPNWNFKLTADRMNAGDLDRWFGPRARPNWLKRLLNSLLGGASPNASPITLPSPAPTDLVRQVYAEGQLNIGELTVEKVRLTQVRAEGTLRELQLAVPDAEAQWAGGTVRAQIHATFIPLPKYDVTARLDGVNLAGISSSPALLERFAGVGSGSVHLATQGVGRDDLLQNLVGSGRVQLRNVEFRGWDVSASVADGAPHAGISQWTSGDGTFTMRNRSVAVENFTLERGSERTSLQGTVTFARDADLTVHTSTVGRRAARAVGVSNAGPVLRIFGPLDGPRVSVEKAAARQPAD
jgi:AsmA family/AsmA-like C-terminal region